MDAKDANREVSALKKQWQEEKEAKLSIILDKYQQAQIFLQYDEEQPPLIKDENWSCWELFALSVLIVAIEDEKQHATWDDLTKISRNDIVKMAHNLIFYDEVDLNHVNSLLYVAKSKGDFRIFHDTLVNSYAGNHEKLPHFESKKVEKAQTKEKNRYFEVVKAKKTLVFSLGTVLVAVWTAFFICCQH